MAFQQFKLTKSVNQSRGIFDKYIYETDLDTAIQVRADGYFLESRFNRTEPNEWAGGIIECRCSDQYFIGQISNNGSSVDPIITSINNIVTTAASTTAYPNQILICSNSESIDVTLSPDSSVGDRLYIKRKDATVNVIGQIDGVTNKTINVVNYAMHLVFDGTEWSEI